MQEPCGCYIENGKLAKQCMLHKRREKLIVQRALFYVQTKVRKLFGETYLKEMEAKVIAEIKKVENET